MLRRVLAVLALLILPATAASAPRFIHVSWSKPDAATTQTVTWMTDSTEDSSMVQYGIDDVTENEFEGYAFQGNDELGAIHVVELEDLEPDTTYVYRVGGLNGGWSGNYEFATGPADKCTPFRFAAFGDNRPDTDWLPQVHWNPVLGETTDAGPAFYIHTGDLVKDGKETGQWNAFLETSEPYLASTPLMATIGNHDDGPGDGDDANYNQIFSYPRNEVTDTEDYYYFIYGNTIVVSLSTGSFTGGSPPLSEQAEWLDKVFSQHPSMKWRIVFLHHPPFASHLVFDWLFGLELNHAPNEQGQNAALIPIFDKHHVDLVFNGHNHYYERLGPMVQGSDDDQGQPVGSFEEGTVYVITGGAGAMIYDTFGIGDFAFDPLSFICGLGQAEGSEVCVGDYHYVSVDIDENVLTYEAWATAEQTLGNNPDNKKIIDSFFIEKEPAESCEEEPDPVEPVVEIVEEPFVIEEADFEVVSQPEDEPDVAAYPEAADDLTTPAADVAGKDGGVVPPPDTSGSVDIPAEVVVPGITGQIEGKEDGGCGCRLAPNSRFPAAAALLLLLSLALLGCLRRSY